MTKIRIHRKKITWVTPDYFVDCDFNPGILQLISVYYDIHWIVLLPHKDRRFTESDFSELEKISGLTIEYHYSNYRQRDPRRLYYYLLLFKKIKEIDSDILYLNCVPDPYFTPFYLLLDKTKTIYCAHDGGVHSGFDFKILTKIVFRVAFLRAKHVCLFSPSQASLFKKNFPNIKTYVILLALKSFGKSNKIKPSNETTFLSFGVINYSKNIELLIDAACNVYDKGYRNFKVSINGKCDNWDFYKSRIRHPSIFNCKIRLIENAEIPDLFSSANYFVQPYRHVSQSGALKVAFNYNLPVIASDFPGFSDEIKEGINGYLFKPNEVEELEKIMIRCIMDNEYSYSDLLTKMNKHTKDNYATPILAKRYLSLFNEIIRGKN